MPAPKLGDAGRVQDQHAVALRGAWGVVSKGLLKRPTGTEQVAVKMLPEMTSEEERRVVRRELEVPIVSRPRHHCCCCYHWCRDVARIRPPEPHG